MAKNEVSTEVKKNKDYEAGLKKQVLITGGNGFLGRHISERFIHEGWDVLVVDDKTSRELTENKLSVKFYKNSITDVDVEEIFRVNNIDVVIHLAERSTSTKGGEAVDNNQINISGLMNILHLSSSYNVGKFFYISTGSLLAYNVENAPEGYAAEPVTTRALTKYLGEQYIQLWHRLFSLETVIVRLSTIYGPGQLPSHGVVADFMSNAVRWKSVEFHGSTHETRDFLYVDDAAFAIFLAVQRDFHGDYLNVSSGQAVSFHDFVKTCDKFMKLPEIDYFDDVNNFQRASLDNTLSKNELGWRQKFSLEEGLKLTYEWYVENNEERTRRRSRLHRDLKLEVLAGKLRPYLENALFLLFVFGVSVLQGDTPVNQTAGFDICYLYIISMGVLYGKKQSVPAVICSILILTWSMLANGGELVSILYPAPNLLHYSSYIFIGALTGYVTDNKNRQLEEIEYKAERLKERYDFLENTYHDSIAIKDKMYRQIINSDDSIGWLYKVIQNLDSVEVENVFTQAANITSQIMNVKNVAIYVMGQDGYYMRQKVRLGELTNELPHSLRVEDLPFKDEVIKNKQVYVNATLTENVPDLVAPIVYDDKVIAIIELFGMNFDQWSIYEQNLFSITTRMISMSMGRAYMYEQEIADRRYVNGTRIMKEEEFEKQKKESMNRASMNAGVRVSLLEFDVSEIDYVELDRRLGRNIRTEDVIGISNGSVYMLLNDVPEQAIEMLMKRIENTGVNIVRYISLA